MNRSRTLLLIGFVGAFSLMTVVSAVPPKARDKSNPLGNAYYLYTNALRIDDSGVVKVPSRFRWSVETSWRGQDVKGKALPDTRIMLRLYDPDHNFTAVTAQMDLETATELHRELGDILEKKLADPDFQYRRQSNDPKLIPTGRSKGIDKNGQAIIELEYPNGVVPPVKVPE